MWGLGLALLALPGMAPTRRQLMLGGASLMAGPGIASSKVYYEMERYGDRELQVATLNRLKQSVRDAVAADPSLLPVFYELAVGDALSFEQSTGNGGLDGSIQFSKTLPPEARRGVDKLLSIRSALMRQTEVTFADLLAYAGSQAVEAVRGPKIPVQLGREDATASDADDAAAWAMMDADQIRVTFARSGLGPREAAVALATSATLRVASAAARARQADTFNADEDAEASEELAGYVEPDTKYNALGVDVRLQDGVGAIETARPFDARYVADLADGRPPDAVGQVLLSDEALRSVIVKYAGKPGPFFQDVAQTYDALTLLGRTTITRNS